MYSFKEYEWKLLEIDFIGNFNEKKRKYNIYSKTRRMNKMNMLPFGN